jgi:2,5-diamino-6-(ribosylamino)-4(3H)-pyrimidinone 5'-phosphate reductase
MMMTGAMYKNVTALVLLQLINVPDGRHEIPTVFNGVSPTKKTAVPLKVKSVERRPHDALWLRYEVVRSEL